MDRICDLIIAQNLNITWSCNARADTPYETLKKMKAAGCRLLVVGYESGSQEILNNINKGITLEQSREFALNTRKLGLKTFGCFMIGLSGETRKTIAQTFNFAKETDADMVFFQQAVPFPGTDFFNFCKENNMLKTENFDKWLTDQGYLDCLVNYPEFNADEVESIRNGLMSKYYFSISYIMKTLFRNPQFSELKRISKAALTYIVFRIKKAFLWNTAEK